MAVHKAPGGRLSRPAYTKTPFGGVPAAKGKPGADELLPGRKALAQVAKPGANIQEFNRLDPIGSGALNTDFLNTPKGFQ